MILYCKLFLFYKLTRQLEGLNHNGLDFNLTSTLLQISTSAVCQMGAQKMQFVTTK